MNKVKWWVGGVAAVVILSWARGQSDLSAQSYTAEPVAEPRPVFDLPLVASEAAPETGTFWLYSKSAGEAGWPPLPFDPYAGVLPIYILPGGQYLVADTPTDFAELQALQFQMAQLESGATLTTMDSSSELPPFPDDGDTNSGGGTLDGPLYNSPSYPSNALWLEITCVSNGVANLIIHGTLPDTWYELLSKEDLTNGQWQSELPMWPGAPDQDWTPATVTVGTRTNHLFLSARSWADADGNGIPDWWEQQYFEQSGVDAYADPDGDGWANLQEYQNGTDPNNFNTPPAPQGLVVHVNDAGTVATVDWLSMGSAVTGYVVERTFDEVANDYSVTAPSYVDNTYLVPSGEYDYADIPAFRVRAQYANGLSAWSDWQWPQECLNPVSAQMVTAPSAGGMLSAQNIPADADALRLNGYYFDEATADYVTTNLTLAVADFTNGLAMLPTVAQSHSYFWNCQALRHSGLVTIRGPVYASDGQGKIFMDGREHLRQNLAYALRAASVVEPFVLSESAGPLNGETSLDCLVADYHWADDTWLPNLAGIDVWQPFEQNYALRNTTFDPQALDANGWLTTGFTNSQGGGFSLMSPAAYEFDGVGVFGTFQPLLSAEVTQWVCPGWADWALGIAYEVLHTVTLTNNTRNYFGLEILSAQVAWPGTTAVVRAGETITNWNAQDFPHFYPETEQPIFQNVGFYFGHVGSDPLPGHFVFTITNTTPLIIAPVGDPGFEIAGYAKLAIANGYANKFAYLGQYFDKAYKANPNGTRSTNETGFLSPYGEFFPTEPGKTFLTTKPDGVSTNVGECVVNVIKLQLDVNHDGTMETAWNSPDNTTQNNPFVFWVNNNYDRLTIDKDDNTYYDDDVSPANQSAKSPYTGVAEPDNEYRDPSGNRVIPCARDLEDFARLWILGLGTNLLADMPSDWQITLDWGDVGAPDMNNPAIDLFVAQDFDGGIAYLTNAADAQVQTLAAYNPWLGRLGPGQQIHLRGAQFTNGWAGNYFIWCGAKAGTGNLTLTVANGNGDTVAQTTACIQIRDIKQMYERWTVGDQPGVSPATNAVPAAEDLPPFTPAFQYPLSASTNTPFILYVHGWNMDRYAKDRFAESAFKRLYWQGYQGRFGVFRWPTDYNFKGGMMDALFQPRNYDGSEFNAWKSATGLMNKLSDLDNQNPDHVYMLAHSMGNVVAGEALRLAGSNQVVNTYVASQGAIPAHAYDSTVPSLIDFTHTSAKIPNYLDWQPLASYGPTTPNIYGDRLADTSTAVGRRINFFNANDFALSPDAWCFNQELKPDDLILGQYHYAGSTNDPAPWNHFEFIPIGENALSFDIVTNLQDLYEVMAYAAEARSRALGTSPNVGGLANVDLQTIWPSDPSGHSYTDHFWHSAQFRGDYWEQWGYWGELLGSDAFNLKQP